RGEVIESVSIIDTQELALSPDEREIYDKLDIRGKKVFLKLFTKAREEGIKEGIRKERQKGKFSTNLIFVFLAIFVAVVFDVFNAFFKNENIVQLFILFLNAIVYGLQMIWLVIITVRESLRNSSCKYYVATFVPLFLGVLLSVILIFVCITPTVAIAW
ncbi:19747_t:CDS:2, partial [Gigaspora rosea]